MESCVVICRSRKPKARKGKVLFINAVNAVTRERAQSFLTEAHQQRIVKAYRDFAEEPGFAHVGTLEEIRGKEGSLNIALYVTSGVESGLPLEVTARNIDLHRTLCAWLNSSSTLRQGLEGLLVN
jgi:type I restriction enzyme M protein